MSEYPTWLTQLAIDLEEAAEAFRTETDHGERLLALMHALGAVIDAFHKKPGLHEHLLPFLALMEAIDHLVQGNRDPLLRPRHIGGRPQVSGTRIVEQVAGVLAATYLIGSGFPAFAADKAAAGLLAAHGVHGQGRRPTSQRTITDWRLNAGEFGDLAVVRQQVALYLPAIDPTMPRAQALELAANAVSRILATRVRIITE